MMRALFALVPAALLAGCLSFGGGDAPPAATDGGPQPPAVPVPEVETQPLPPQ